MGEPAPGPVDGTGPSDGTGPAPGTGPADGTRVADPDRRWRTRHLPPLVLASAAVACLAAVVGGVLAGGAGALGAAAGVVIVTLGYVASTLVIARADAANPQLVLPVGLAAYVTKLTVLVAVFLAVAATGWSGLVPFSLGVAAGVVGWTGAHLWWITR